MKIEGLNKKQRMFCDILYKFDYIDQIYSFMDSLPEEDKKLCEVAYNMMLASALDQNHNIDTAREVWNSLREQWDVNS